MDVRWALVIAVVSGCGDDGGGSNPDGSSSSDGSIDAPLGARPHPLYPPLDLDTLPGPGGGLNGAYEPPMLPVTTRNVMVTSAGAQARADIQAACQVDGTAVTVSDAAGRIGVLDLGNFDDCDITLGPQVIADLVFVGHLPGPTVAPVHRVRIRGGQFGSVAIDAGSSDIVFDGVVINNAVMPPAQRGGTGIYFASNVNRLAFVNSIIRMVGTVPDGSGNIDGCAYLGAGGRNVLFANNNVVTAGNRNSWGFRIGGGDNYLFVDNTVRVSMHKLIRMNDGPVDYVYVRGGTWMREATLTAGGLSLNDSFAQLGDSGTDHIYIHDPEIYLLSTTPVTFGATSGPGQAGKSWEARRISWHARNASAVSDELLGNQAQGCTAGAICDYGLGTHTYQYDANLAFPADPWRDLPTIAVDDPDQQPIAP